MTKAKNIIIILMGIGFFFLFFMPYLFVPFMDSYLVHMDKYIIDPIGVSNLPDFLRTPTSVLIGMIPLGCVLFFISFLIHRKFKDKTSDRSKNQLIAIKQAMENLQDSLNFLAELKQSITDKTKKYNELEEAIEQLDLTSRESASDLKAKLNAIDFVNGRTKFLKLSVSFGLGILASLIATSIWEFFVTKS